MCCCVALQSYAHSLFDMVNLQNPNAEASHPYSEAQHVDDLTVTTVMVLQEALLNEAQEIHEHAIRLAGMNPALIPSGKVRGSFNAMKQSPPGRFFSWDYQSM